MDLWRPGSSSGVLVPVEFGWLPTFGDGFKGSYKFGAWYNSSTAPDVVENVFGLPLSVHGGRPSCTTVSTGRTSISCKSSPRPRRIEGSVHFSMQPMPTGARPSSTIRSQRGFFIKGLSTIGPADELGFAIGRTHVNSRIANVETQVNAAHPGSVGVQGSEYVAELFYGVHVTRWLDLRPNIQYIAQPGGIARNANDVIVGLRVTAGL